MDIRQTYRELTGKGVVFKDGIKEAPGFVKFLSITDPDGNPIECREYLRDLLKKA